MCPKQIAQKPQKTERQSKLSVAESSVSEANQSVVGRGGSNTKIITFSQIQILHISLESNLDRFLIPKIPKMDLRSSKIVESDGTLGISKTKNVPIFYIYL